MKKNILIITAISSTLALASCGGDSTKSDSSAEAKTDKKEVVEEVEVANWTVNSENSNVRWEAGTAGANVYSHFGNIDVQKGALTTEGNAITEGTFVVDMTTITPKDDSYGEDNPASKLVAHLSSPDFFAVEEHPMATFEVTGSEDNKVMGNLTIRGNTNPEVIEISSMEMNDDGTMTAKGMLVFDRQKYDVAWEHYLEDTVLSDDIELEITLVASKA